MAADREWDTVPAGTRVLAVGRTLTSTLRVLEALATLAGDVRLRVCFTVNDSSPFSGGVRQLLADLGARVIPWDAARREPFDLIVTASENTELTGFDAPILVLPHGVGFQKLLPDTRPTDPPPSGGAVPLRLSGSLRREDVAGRRVTIAVSHQDQAAQLIEHSPFLAGRTAVVEDPVHTRLLASRRLREHYRPDGRRLVVLASTWGKNSLLGRWPDLAVRLLAELPADEYRVAAILHPNIWTGEGAWQINFWQARALRAGLMVMPPEGSWPALLVAADCVVGDHGSVSMYAAAADRPLLLAPLTGETVPGTAMAHLAEVAERLEPRRSLHDQVVAAITGHKPDRFADVTAGAFSPQARPLRSVFYRLLELDEPAYKQPLLAFPVPEPEGTPPSAFAVYTRLSGAVVEVRRVPAAADSPGTAPDGWWRHLAVEDGERDQPLWESASVLVSPPRPVPGRTAVVPGPDGATITLPDGTRIEAEGRGDPMLLSAVVWTLSQADRPLDGSVTLRVGDASLPVSLRRPG
jgi:hypothetical protein